MQAKKTKNKPAKVSKGSIRTSLYLTKNAIRQGKMLASARDKNLSEVVEDLIMKNFNVQEITDAASDASRVESPDERERRQSKEAFDANLRSAGFEPQE